MYLNCACFSHQQRLYSDDSEFKRKKKPEEQKKEKKYLTVYIQLATEIIFCFLYKLIFVSIDYLKKKHQNLFFTIH